MCFDNDNFVEFSQSEVVKCRKPHRCDECGRPIPAGELAEHHSGKCDGSFFSSYFCGECEATRHKVHEHELADGCSWDESWCPIGELAEYCKDTNITRVDFAAGQERLVKSRAEQARQIALSRERAALRKTDPLGTTR